jgi:hypothetical protein
MDVLSADECNVLLEAALASLQLAVTFPAPSYIAWLLATDLTTQYDAFSWLLNIQPWSVNAQWWALKSPFHLLAYDQLMRLWPRACLVQIYRDPTYILKSWYSLVAAARRAVSHSTFANLKDEWLPFWDQALRKGDAALSHKPEGWTLIGIEYEQLIADPLTAVAQIYDAVGRTLPVGTTRRMQRVVADMRPSPPHYAGSSTDIDSVVDAMRERYRTMVFAS